MNALIGSGFYAADMQDFQKKREFHLRHWLPNVGDRDYVVVDNSEPPVPKIEMTGRGRLIEVRKNAGHVGSMLGQYRPHLGGWSLSWIIHAFIAYSEGRDFIYQEQDCLAFGDWEQTILSEMDERGLVMAFGDGSDVSCCEQSLFYIKHEFITEAVYKYLSIADGDGKILPEEKFQIMERNDYRIGRFSLKCGRNRPLPLEEKTWYSQKFSPDELDQLKEAGLV